MPNLIRSAVLSNYVEVARSVGLDPHRMISEFRIPPAALNDSEVKISASAVGRLLEESAARSGKLDFGLRLADKRTVANLGALALLAREQPSIRKALDVMAAYMFLHRFVARLTGTIRLLSEAVGCSLRRDGRLFLIVSGQGESERADHHA